MKILLIASYLPYPLFSGGHVRLYNILKELSRNHKVTLICEKRDYQSDADIEEVAQFCEKVLTVPRKKQWTLANIIKTGFSSKPFLITGHTSKEIKKLVAKELDENSFDILHVETFYVMQNLPLTKVPTVLGEQNVEYLVYKRYADHVLLPLKYLLRVDVVKMKRWEEHYWKKAGFVVVTSDNEKTIVEKYNKKVTIVPNGVDLKRFSVSKSRFSPGREKTILFIGDFRWVENKDAIDWLLTAIWPRLKLKAASEELTLKLWVVGKKIPETVRLLTDDPDVRFDENAPNDTKEIYESADMLLAPIRVGSGGKFKILESMASMVPIVTTTIGMEGIEGEDGKHVLIGETAQELVEKTINVLKDEKLYGSISTNAKKLIEEKYEWGKIVKGLEKVYESVTK